MNNLKFKTNRVWYFIVTLCIPGGLLAVESDNLQGIQFSSDGGSTMRTNGNVRILEMSDNVKIAQGTLQISGSTAVFEYVASSNELTRITVHGTPVRYQQQLDEDGGLVIGTSNTILYYTDEIDGETIIELIGSANVTSPDSAMKCASITYLATRDLIREATGPCEGVLNTQSN